MPPSKMIGWPRSSGRGENPFVRAHRHQHALVVQAVVVAEVGEEAAGRQNLDTIEKRGNRLGVKRRLRWQQVAVVLVDRLALRGPVVAKEELKLAVRCAVGVRRNDVAPVGRREDRPLVLGEMPAFEIAVVRDRGSVPDVRVRHSARRVTDPHPLGRRRPIVQVLDVVRRRAPAGGRRHDDPVGLVTLEGVESVPHELGGEVAVRPADEAPAGHHGGGLLVRDGEGEPRERGGEALAVDEDELGRFELLTGVLAAGASRRDLTGARLPCGADPACAASDPPIFHAVNGAASASATSVTT